MVNILMVCLGNICRSPLAQGILESKLPASKFKVDSAGTANYHIGKSPDHRSIVIAKEKGIDISNQKCRQFVISDFDNFDIIYVMDQSNYENVVKLARNTDDISKVKLILQNHESLQEVPDPYWGNIQDFEDVFVILDDICEKISHNLNGSPY